jgi:uncharacterized protein YjbI with pentapeptide repeats
VTCGSTTRCFGARTSLTRACFQGANLFQSTLNDAQCQGAAFTGVDLRGASFSNLVLKGACFKNANLERAAFQGLQEGALDGADFSGAHGTLRKGQLAHIAEGNTSR